MIRHFLRAMRHIDKYEWVGIACGVLLLCVMTGVLGPTLDAQSIISAQEGRQTIYASKDCDERCNSTH